MDEELAGALQRFHLDPDLEVAPCVTLLLLATVDTALRFRQYEGYPFKLYQICRRFCEHWRTHCLAFLSVPDEELDTGFGLRLKRAAQSAGETE